MDLPDKLTPLTLEFVKQAARTGSRAFMDDPTTAYLIPDPVLRPRLHYAFEYYLRLAVFTKEEAYVTSPACQGLAVWMRPGHEASLLASMRAGWPFDLLRCGLTYLIRDYQIEHHFGQLRTQLAPRRHMYLALLAVDPSFQGRGYASILLRSMLKRLNKEKLPAYLETQNRRNVVMYQHYGFKLVREEAMPGADFSLFCMLREPQE
jgi:ribosomal protein S18 acetylase RimI-like enzyme